MVSTKVELTAPKIPKANDADGLSILHSHEHANKSMILITVLYLYVIGESEMPKADRNSEVVEPKLPITDNVSDLKIS